MGGVASPAGSLAGCPQRGHRPEVSREEPRHNRANRRSLTSLTTLGRRQRRCPNRPRARALWAGGIRPCAPRSQPTTQEPRSPMLKIGPLLDVWSGSPVAGLLPRSGPAVDVWRKSLPTSRLEVAAVFLDCHRSGSVYRSVYGSGAEPPAESRIRRPPNPPTPHVSTPHAATVSGADSLRR